MQAPEIREIGGHAWTVTKFTGRESLALFRQLTALAAEPLSDAVREVAGSVKAADEADLTDVLSLAGGAVGLAGKIAAKLSDAEFETLVVRLLKFTQCDNKAVAFDALFQGDLPTLFKVLAFIVEINFVGPFVSSLGPAVSTVLQKLTAMGIASSPETSSETKPTT